MLRLTAVAASFAAAAAHSSLLAAVNPLAKGYPSGYVSVAPLQDGNFTNKAGFLDAGNDILNGNYNYDQALSICSANVECMGFTFESTDPQPAQAVNVYFKRLASFTSATGWQSWVRAGPTPYPSVNFTVGGLAVGLRANARTVQVMNLVSDPMPPYNFSWVPPLKAANRNTDRSVPSCHQLGDVTLRFQPLSSTNASSWAMYTSTWGAGMVPAVPQPQPWPAGYVASDDISGILNATPPDLRVVPYPLSLKVVRSWDTSGGLLSLRVNITALTDTRIGGMGFSLPADDNTDQSLDAIAYTNSLVDPHIGSDHAWAEWVRIIGNQSLLVTPAAGTSARTRMEAWRPLLDDCAFNGGMAEWTVLSAAWASEWDSNRQAPVLSMPSDLADSGVWGPSPASPWPSWQGNRTLVLPGMRDRYWNTPTSVELKAGQSVTYGLTFSLTAGGPRAKDAALQALGEPVINAVPGYTLGSDMNSSYMLVQPNGGRTVASVTATPSGIVSLGTPVPLAGGWYRVSVLPAGTPTGSGRVRLSIALSDGTEAVAHYRVLPPFAQQVASLGQHWANDAWLPRDYPDPFGRSASVMPWDRESKAHAIDDSRAYIVGLSDDAGAAQNLGFATKVSWAPVQAEVALVDSYIADTLYGIKTDTAQPPYRSLQGRPEDGSDYQDRIRMTVYYYCATFPNCKDSGHWPYPYPEQDKCNMPVGGPIWCMTENMANATYRGYNWPHSTAVWYGMYRVARFYDRLPTAQPWDYYLYHAYALAMTLGAPDVGFMDGTVFRELLVALEEEGAVNATIAGWAQALGQNMKQRADGWSQQLFPFGSEFNYDTTGQEEVYVWLSYYNYSTQAAGTLESILGYMRDMPNWAWQGGARSMGDLGNNGLWFVNRGGERVLMHYRSGLNMIPLMEAYRQNPDDSFLLRPTMGAVAGQMANIDPSTGATSMGFHSFPFVLEFDPRSGDYGLGFFGHSTETAAIIARDSLAPSGWACYLCNVWSTPAPVQATSVSFSPVDSYRARVYLEPVGVHMLAQAGTIQSVQLDLQAASATVTFDAPTGSPLYSALRLRVTKEAASRPGSSFTATDASGNGVPVVRGAYQVPANPNGPTVITLHWQA